MDKSLVNFRTSFNRFKVSTSRATYEEIFPLDLDINAWVNKLDDHEPKFKQPLKTFARTSPLLHSVEDTTPISFSNVSLIPTAQNLKQWLVKIIFFSDFICAEGPGWTQKIPIVLNKCGFVLRLCK